MAREPKHHYIPIFYLQQWAGKDGRLVEYCRRYEGLVARPTHPDGTGYVRGLYKLPDVGPGREYVIETDLMCSIDNSAARALQRLLLDDQFSGNLAVHEAIGWCQFLYSLIVRNPEHLVRMKEKLATLDVSDTLEELRERYTELRGPNDPESFEEYKEAFLKKPIEVPPVRVLPQLMGSKRVIRELASLKWRTTTLRTAKHPLLTSDRPVVMTNGLIQDDAHIVLPLSPRLLFIATKTEETAQFFNSMNPSELAEAVNNQVAQQAYKFVYGMDDSQLRFVANRLGKRVRSSPLD